MNFLTRLFYGSEAQQPKELSAIERANITLDRLVREEQASNSSGSCSPLSIPAVFTAIDSNCNAMATIPYCVWNDKNEKAYDHWSYSLMNYKPNDYQTPAQFWKKLFLDMQLEQEAFVLAKRNGTRVEAMENIDPSRVELEKGIYYLDKKEIDPYLLWHFVGFSLDGRRGKSQYELSKDTVLFAQALEQSGLNFYLNGCRASGLLIMPPGLTPEETKAYQKEWKKTNNGSKNSGNTPALPTGFDYKQLGSTPQDNQYGEISVHQMRQAARLTGTPPFVYSDYERQTWANIAYARMDWVQRSLRPLAVTVEQVLNSKLFKTSEQGKYRVELILEGLQRGSYAEQIDTLTTAVGGPVMTRAEARGIINLPNEPEADETNTTVEGTAPVAEGETVQDQAMNGAQTASLLQISTMVTTKQIPPEAAKLIIQSAFPSLPVATITAIVDSLAAFEPEPVAVEPPPETPVAPPQEEETPPVEETNGSN